MHRFRILNNRLRDIRCLFFLFVMVAFLEKGGCRDIAFIPVPACGCRVGSTQATTLEKGQ